MRVTNNKQANSPQRRTVVTAMFRIGLFSVAGFVISSVVAPSMVQAGVELRSPADTTRVHAVHVDVSVVGKVQTPIEKKKFKTLDLNLKAVFEYSERHLAGLGPKAQGLRSIRMISEAGAVIEIGNESSSLRLRDGRRLLIAQGQKQGMTYYSPDGPMTFNELELLTHPGDSLAIWGLLPEKTVEIGDTWDCENWVAQVLADVNAVFKNELACKLESVDDGIAKISFGGAVAGASDGAGVEVNVSGTFEFDVAQQLIRELSLKQIEKRDPGTVSSGIDVVATVVVKQELKPSTTELGNAAIAKKVANSGANDMLLQFRSPWQVGFLYDRDWHIFQQTSQFAVMRLLDEGLLVAQCNLTKLPKAAAGTHTDPQKFEADVQEALGEQLERIVESGELKTDNGDYHYRVVAQGKVGELPMLWIYYLCAAPDGQQTALVFVLEPKNQEKLNGRDLKISQSLTFHSAGNAIRPASTQP